MMDFYRTEHAIGNTTFWDGTAWVIDDNNIFNSGGNDWNWNDILLAQNLRSRMEILP